MVQSQLSLSVWKQVDSYYLSLAIMMAAQLIKTTAVGMSLRDRQEDQKGYGYDAHREVRSHAAFAEPTVQWWGTAVLALGAGLV